MTDFNFNLNQPTGFPGSLPHWQPGPKLAVGTAISTSSNVWFTIGESHLNEIYFPRVDLVAINDLKFVVSDGQDYLADEEFATAQDVDWLAPDAPAFKTISTAQDGYFKLEKIVITSPVNDSLLLNIKFTNLAKRPLKLYLVINPRLGNMGYHNSGHISTYLNSDHQETLALNANCKNIVLSAIIDRPIAQASVGYVGYSDGLTDLVLHKNLTTNYQVANDGHISLVAEIELDDNPETEFNLAIGFSNNFDLAFKLAQANLKIPFEQHLADYIASWQAWHAQRKGLKLDDFAKKSLTVLKVHQSKNPEGGLIAGLASPWGNSRSDDDPIGYHIVWTRDMVESAGGFLAVGMDQEFRSMINFLVSTQREDGHWPQNMWIDGQAFWRGVQMDETALPVILIYLGYRHGALKKNDLIDYWPMVKKALGYIVRNGPITSQDRWEEDPGYTPFTIATEITALNIGAEFAEINHELKLVNYLHELADNWFLGIDRWMLADNTALGLRYGVKEYYMRIAPVDQSLVNKSSIDVNVKNVDSQQANQSAAELISPDCLALVRFGLRLADDPRIVDSLKLIDQLLKKETPSGESWHRYNYDGYGETVDGQPFSGLGVGRLWPLLTGERAHYEILNNNLAYAQKLAKDMTKMASKSGLLPEQIWDQSDIPANKLFFGRPTGSAMPLAWAHAEYLKLIRSIDDQEVFDFPVINRQKYLVKRADCRFRIWRYNHRIRELANPNILRIETLDSAMVHYSLDDWQHTFDEYSFDIGLGLHYLDIDLSKIDRTTNHIIFTFYWTKQERWENENFEVKFIFE